jgi:MFS family permease
MGAPVGFVFANGFYLILGAVLTDDQFREWGWRLPFLASALLVALGLWVRLTLTETPEFVKAGEKAPPPQVPIGELVRNHAFPTIAGTMGTIACFALFYISTLFVIGYGTKGLRYDRETFLGIELVAILFMAAGIVTAGVAADRYNAGRMLTIGCIVAIPVGLSMSALLVPGSLISVFLWLAFALFTMGFVYGPLGAWLPSLFPARVRYTGVSVTFNLGGIIGGGLTPLIAETLVKNHGIGSVGLYLSGAALLSLIGLVLLRKK